MDDTQQDPSRVAEDLAYRMTANAYAIRDWEMQRPAQHDTVARKAKFDALEALYAKRDSLRKETAMLLPPEQAAPPVPVVTPAAVDDGGWRANALRLADEIGLKKWNRGERLFSVRSISESVAAELGKGTTNSPTAWWGTQGPRSTGAIRTALKGWQFTPPNSGINGTSCTE